MLSRNESVTREEPSAPHPHHTDLEESEAGDAAVKEGSAA